MAAAPPAPDAPHGDGPPAASLQQGFKDVMAGVATPVSVVTAVEDGSPHGTTVSAFASLSLDPVMVLVSLARESELLAVVRRTGRFGVNVLGAAQGATALAFARKGGAAKFEGARWSLDHGLPRLDEAPGWLACTVDELVVGGDHVVALGRVDAAEARGGEPLVYHGRRFGTHAPHPA